MAEPHSLVASARKKAAEIAAPNILLIRRRGFLGCVFVVLAVAWWWLTDQLSRVDFLLGKVAASKPILAAARAWIKAVPPRGALRDRGEDRAGRSGGEEAVMADEPTRPTTALNLDAWWDDPVYKPAQATFSELGAFILAKLREHAAAKFQHLILDLYRDARPDPMDITKFQWATILAFMARARKRSRTCSCG